MDDGRCEQDIGLVQNRSDDVEHDHDDRQDRDAPCGETECSV